MRKKVSVHCLFDLLEVSLVYLKVDQFERLKHVHTVAVAVGQCQTKHMETESALDCCFLEAETVDYSSHLIFVETVDYSADYLVALEDSLHKMLVSKVSTMDSIVLCAHLGHSYSTEFLFWAFWDLYS